MTGIAVETAAISSWTSELHGRLNVGCTLLWIGAVAGAVVVHVGLAAWALWQAPIEMADNAPPPAIMIELAAEPEAVNADQNEISR